MKRILLASLLLVIFLSPGFAQINVWRWQNPLPEGDFLYAVQMFSLNSIYACGENGTFMRTSDGGQTWDLQTNVLKIKTTWKGISFITENYGMICGDSGRIIKTTNGGSSWTVLKDSAIPDSKLNGIIVIDTNIALVVTLGGGVLRTVDGGSSWHLVPMENTYALYSIRKLRSDFIALTGYDGTVMKSVDSGNSWGMISTPYRNTYHNVCFTDDSNATLLADNGLILHTTNSGNAWVRDEIDSNAITATLNDIDGKDPNILAMVGDYGTILYTNDGGSSWTQSFIGTNEHLKGISFFDKLNATAVGRDGVILKTTDGGKDWFFVPQTPEFTTMYSVAFPKGDTSLGIAVGQQGTIKRTTNGGKLWTVISSGTPNTLHCVTFSDSITAYCVGDYGTVLKSKDGGLTWNSLQSTTTRNLYSISFATANDGLAVGDTNTILRTYTSGQFWTHEFPPTSKDTDKMLMVSYPDSKHAFLMGFYNLYSTADGGISWNNILGHNGQLYPAVSFVDSLHGAILGSDNPAHIVYWFAKFTSNGGLTWNTILTPDNVPLNDIQCVDKLHATIVGHGGYIGHTSDGGITINQQVSNTVNNLYGVGFGSVLAGNAVGIRGNIMRITTDDIPVSFVKESPGMGPRVVFEGNYPNPFNTSTIIKYSLPLPGISTIEIFSIEGKLIATLETEYQSLGDHSIRFERAALSAGTYICRITNNGMRAEGKIIVEN